MEPMTSALFTPFDLRGLALPNRIVISPMCQYSAAEGSATDWHCIHLGQLAIGGAGLLFVEATAVEPVGRITPSCLGLWSDDNERALSRIIAVIRKYSPIALGIQLCHAGRKGSSEVPWRGGALIPPERGGWTPVAPSAVPHQPDEPPPAALDRHEIARIADAFVASAQRALRLGFDALELHCAHGYLLHEFLSPISNRRSDEYGGSRANRMRFPLEVFERVRGTWGTEKPLGARISATDWVEGGWSIDDSVAFAHELRQRGCDWIDCSSGGVSPQQKIPLGPGYQVPLAKRIRTEVGIPTTAIGLITDPRHAESIIAAGEADLVALARGMLYDPRWAWHAAATLGASTRAPEQYWRCAPREAGRVFGDTHVGQR